MDTTLEKLKKYFPALPQNAITKIYRARCARLKLLMDHGIPEDIRWLIEAKFRLSSESSNSFISHMPGTGTSTFAKKRRAKRLKVCHRCARWTCNMTCRSLGMVSVNREDKIQFIKDGDTTKSLMSSPKCRSVEVVNNPARPGSNHKEVNYINYK